MSKIIGTSIALLLTTASVVGITALIASDFVDVSAVAKSALGYIGASTNAGNDKSNTDPFENFGNFTFFKSEKISGTKLEVTTGGSFASAEDVAIRKTKTRWCYLNYGDGEVTRRITLGNQEDASAPVYSDLHKLPSSEFLAIGLSATRLTEIAKSHCHLGKFDPRTTNEG